MSLEVRLNIIIHSRSRAGRGACKGKNECDNSKSKVKLPKACESPPVELGSCAPVDPRRGLDEVAEMDRWTRLCDVEPDPELLELPCEGDWEAPPAPPEPVPPVVCGPPPAALLVAPDMFLRESEDPDRLPSLST